LFGVDKYHNYEINMKAKVQVKKANRLKLRCGRNLNYQRTGNRLTLKRSV